MLTRHIENAIGSLEKPMSDAALDAKFTDLADGILPQAQAKALIEKCREIEQLPDAGSLAQAAAVWTQPGAAPWIFSFSMNSDWDAHMNRWSRWGRQNRHWRNLPAGGCGRCICRPDSTP